LETIHQFSETSEEHPMETLRVLFWLMELADGFLSALSFPMKRPLPLNPVSVVSSSVLPVLLVQTVLMALLEETVQLELLDPEDPLDQEEQLVLPDPQEQQETQDLLVKMELQDQRVFQERLELLPM
jgi:hypothetical protein